MKSPNPKPNNDGGFVRKIVFHFGIAKHKICVTYENCFIMNFFEMKAKSQVGIENES